MRELTMSSNRPASMRAAVLLVYAAGFLQGLTLVCVPALSGALKQSLAISDARYGTLFLPQVACTALAALFGGALARRVGLQTLLWLSLLANAISQLAVTASAHVGMDMSFAILLVGTATLGLGFGLSSAPLNSYPPAFFPQHRDASVVALHTALGLGLAAGPLLAGPFLMMGNWAQFSLWLGGISIALAVVAIVVTLPESESGAERHAAHTGSSVLASPALWLFVAIAMLYAFAEGTFSNWAVIYLHEDRALSAAVAASALSVFWGALAVGRLLISALVLRVPPARVWLALPVLMAIAFLMLPLARSPATGIGLFAVAGFACSAFFPLTIGRVSERFPAETALVSSVMVAALMIGVGLGTFLVAPLRAMLSLPQLYRLSALYPIAVVVLAYLALRIHGARPSR